MDLFSAISQEIRDSSTWDQAHCCFIIFSYILTLFLEKNRIFEISWAIDYAVFTFRSPAKSHWTLSDSCGKIAFKVDIPINGLKLDIISMSTFPEICYYAISDVR
ncbi:hypothetical protein T06_5740 [Trichinella sp. T6]|nr:hypothetical protein T06_5740 [Trichinella sp. T6]